MKMLVAEAMKRNDKEIKMIKKKLEELMKLQNNHLTKNLTEWIVNLIAKKKRNNHSWSWMTEIAGRPNMLLAELRPAKQGPDLT